MPTWPVVKETMDYIAEMDGSFDVNVNSPKIFAQYGYVKTYCSSEKLAEWRDGKDKNGKLKSVSTEERWVEVFKHMETEQVPYLEFSRLIEFILCLPGTSAPVERVFSSAKNIWKVESSQLAVKTLKSILLVKMNLKYSCVDFYRFLKTQPKLLKAIASEKKYSFKESANTSAATANVSLMSIDTEPDEAEESARSASLL